MIKMTKEETSHLSEKELKKLVQEVQHKHRFDLTGQDEEAEFEE